MTITPSLKQTLTAYFFVGLAIAIFLLGIYILFSSPIDEKMKDYEKRKQFRERYDENRSTTSQSLFSVFFPNLNQKV